MLLCMAEAGLTELEEQSACWQAPCSVQSTGVILHNPTFVLPPAAEDQSISWGTQGTVMAVPGPVLTLLESIGP